MTSENTTQQTVHESYRRGLAVLGRLLFREGELAMIALFAAMGFTVAGLENISVEPSIFNLAAAGGGAMILGFSARVLFRERKLMLRWSSTMAALVLMLLLMGWFTRGATGVSLSFLPVRPPDWGALFQLLLGGLSGTLSLLARPWWRENPAIALVVEEHPEVAREANVRLASPPEAEPPRVRLHFLERVRSSLRGWRKRVRKDEVRLVGAEEHRCPYCLQLIDSRDSRGVVICPVCHTHHHRDCWAVTGMCQVPHYHA